MDMGIGMVILYARSSDWNGIGFGGRVRGM
jgi:hypothetical protein